MKVSAPSWAPNSTVDTVRKVSGPVVRSSDTAYESVVTIADRAADRTPGAFRYTDKGTMATIGRRAAVAQLPGGLRMRGTLAWLAWLVLHIYVLIGFRNRASVLLNWAWNYLTWDRAARVVLDPVADRVTREAAEADPPEEAAAG